MDLGAHADKLTGGYSGGNKRRLSLAIALIGEYYFFIFARKESMTHKSTTVFCATHTQAIRR